MTEPQTHALGEWMLVVETKKRIDAALLSLSADRQERSAPLKD